jgi:hypothetical protein
MPARMPASKAANIADISWRAIARIDEARSAKICHCDQHAPRADVTTQSADRTGDPRWIVDKQLMVALMGRHGPHYDRPVTTFSA